MSSFRTKVLGLAALATAFASASFGQIVITPNTLTTPGALNLRAEGTTEAVGNVIFQISGGNATAGTITMFYNAPVTTPLNPAGFGTTFANLNYNGANFPGSISGTNQLVFNVTLASGGILAAPTTATVSVVRVNANAVTLGALTTITAQPEVTQGVTSVTSTTPASVVVGFVSTTLKAPSVVGATAAGAPGAFGSTPATYNTGAGNKATTATPGFYISLADTVAGAFKNFNTPANGPIENVDGIANFGTRIQLTFANVPSGATVWVPSSLFYGPAAPPAAATLQLTLVTSATASDGGGILPAVNATFNPFAPASAAAINTVAPAPVTTTIFGLNSALTATGGTATAVYEVTVAPASATVSVQIPAWVTFNANTLTTGSGAVTVLETYAPMAAAAAATTVPNFAPVTTGALNGVTIILAETQLLYTFVTNASGFDTGIAIANTSSDPFGTVPSTGSCNLNFYGTGAPTTNTNVAAPGGATAGGAVSAFLLSGVAPGFTGYMIAVCPFADAHGFAYIVDNANTTNATTMGYLADTISRVATGVPAPGFEVTGQ